MIQLFKKKMFNILLLGILFVVPIRSMFEDGNSPFTSEYLSKFIEEARKEIEARRKLSEQEAQQERNRIEQEKQRNVEIVANRDGTYSQDEIDLAKEALRDYREEQKKLSDETHSNRRKFEELRFKLTEQYTTGILDQVFSQASHARKKQDLAVKASIDARERRKGDVEKAKLFYDFIQKDPAKKVGFLFASSAALTVGYHGVKEGVTLLTDIYKKPQLADEGKSSMQFGFLAALKNIIYGASDIDTAIENVILPPALAERVNEVVTIFKNSTKNGGFLRHIMFYGPPGTGKTMLAMRIARGCGADFICFTASDLEQLSTEAGTAALKEIFRFSKGRSRPVIMFMDEAELLLGNRDNPNMTDKKRTWFNLILGETGTESRDFALIIATNKPETIDKAFLSRCDDRIRIDTPTPKERRAILQLYVDKWIKKGTNLMPRKVSLLSFNYWFAEPFVLKPLVIEDGALSDEALDRISDRIEGFVGRDISKLVIDIQSSALASENRRVTKALVERVVSTKIAQVRDEKTGFKASHGA